MDILLLISFVVAFAVNFAIVLLAVGPYHIPFTFPVWVYAALAIANGAAAVVRAIDLHRRLRSTY